eukprot:994564-Pleurochrysis_carterae.AAC.1
MHQVSSSASSCEPFTFAFKQACNEMTDPGTACWTGSAVEATTQAMRASSLDKARKLGPAVETDMPARSKTVGPPFPAHKIVIEYSDAGVHHRKA